jgi:hypothetical protein
MNLPKNQDKSLYRFLKFYILLVIFEGVFRKWIRLSNVDVFYFLRDLITVLFILKILFLRRHKTLKNQKTRISLNILFSIFILYGFIAVVVQNIPVAVVIFGIRNFVSIFLLVYICSFICDKNRIFTATYRIFIGSLFIQLPIVLLQVVSQPNSFINKTSWDLGASVFTSGEFVRPPGTFTNALGLGYFILITYGLILGSFLKGFGTRKAANRNLVALFLVMIIAAISGSRTVLFGLSLTTSLFVILRLKRMTLESEKSSISKRSSSSILILFSVLIIYVLYKLADVINAFLFRLKYQTEGGNGTRLRIIDSIFGYHISEISLFGTGIGTRHQSALALGWIQPWVENESVRWSAEIGVFGLLLIILRQFWISFIAINVLLNKVKFDYLGPMIFVSLGPVLVSGISTQPTIQGMSAIMLIFLVFRKLI